MDTLTIKRKAARAMYRVKHLNTLKVQTTQDLGFYSQHGQDRFIAELFGQKKNGVFIDVGAHDGVTFSNTCYFERKLNWTGVAVEPSPPVYAKLCETRTCVKLNCCVADYDGQTEFMELTGFTEMFSGIVGEFSDHQRARIDRELKQHGGTQQLIKMDCKTLATLMAEQSISKIDLLSIDTEGSEFSILKKINFTKTPIQVICVENNFGSDELWQLLMGHGYELMAIAGQDEIYKRK